MKKIVLLFILAIVANAQVYQGCSVTKKDALIDLSSTINSSISSSVSSDVKETTNGSASTTKQELTATSKVSTNLDLVNVTYTMDKTRIEGVHCASVTSEEQIKNTDESVKIIRSYSQDVLPKENKDKVKTLTEWIKKLDQTKNLITVFGTNISEEDKKSIFKKSKIFTDIKTAALLTLKDSIWKGCGEDKGEAYAALNNTIFAKKIEDKGFLGLFTSSEDDERNVVSNEIEYIKEGDKNCAIMEKSRLLTAVNALYTKVNEVNASNLPTDELAKYDQVTEWIGDIEQAKQLVQLFPKDFTAKHDEALLSKSNLLKKLQNSLMPQYVKFIVAGENVTVLIDGKQQHSTNTNIHLKTGAHSYVIISNGMCDIQGEFTLEAKAKEEIDKSFDGLSYPKVTFTSNKAQATAIVNGKPLKINVQTIVEKCSNEVPYTVSFNGQIQKGNIPLSAGETLTKNFNFLSDIEVAIFNDMNKKRFSTPSDEKLSGTLSNPSLLSTQLKFEVEDGPKEGSIELSENGGFIYTPEVTFSGNENFTYYIINGETKSALKLGIITVIGNGVTSNAAQASNTTGSTSVVLATKPVAAQVAGLVQGVAMVAASGASTAAVTSTVVGNAVTSNPVQTSTSVATPIVAASTSAVNAPTIVASGATIIATAGTVSSAVNGAATIATAGTVAGVAVVSGATAAASSPAITKNEIPTNSMNEISPIVEFTKNISAISILSGGNGIYNSTFEHNKSGFVFDKKLIKKLEKYDRTGSFSMMLNAKLLIPESVQSDTVNITLNDVPHNMDASGVSKYNISVNDKKMESSSIDADVIHDGKQRYVNLSVSCWSKKGYFTSYFTPHVINNLKKISFSVSSDDVDSIVSSLAIPSSKNKKLFQAELSIMGSKGFKSHIVKNNNLGFIIDKKIFKQLQKHDRNSHFSMTINAKLLIPESISDDSVLITLNAAPHNMDASGVSKYNISVNDKKMESSSIDADVINDGKQRYVNLSINCWSKKGYLTSYSTHYILGNLSKMSFSVSNEDGMYAQTNFAGMSKSNTLKVALGKKDTPEKLNILHSDNGFAIDKKMFKQLQKHDKESSFHMTINTKLLIPESISDDSVLITLNAAPHNMDASGVSKYNISVNDKKMESSSIDADVINDGKQRYVNLSIGCWSKKGYLTSYFIPYVLSNLSTMNFSVSNEDGIFYNTELIDKI